PAEGEVALASRCLLARQHDDGLPRGRDGGRREERALSGAEEPVAQAIEHFPQEGGIGGVESIMKRVVFFIAAGVPAALMTILASSSHASTAGSPKQKPITCPFLKEGRVTFDVPAELGSLPTEIDFDYPAKATRFSFRDKNLSLVAMDESEPSRVRIVISA